MGKRGLTLTCMSLAGICTVGWLSFTTADAAGESENVVINANRPGFTRDLARCAVSVSQAGYNTVADIMAAGCRAVVAPQWNEKETEQLRRAELLAKPSGS